MNFNDYKFEYKLPVSFGIYTHTSPAESVLLDKIKKGKADYINACSALLCLNNAREREKRREAARREYAFYNDKYRGFLDC
jgi:hypothetical protein